MEAAVSSSKADSNPWRVSRWALWVMLIGLGIRLYAYYMLPLFNSDGILYIQQAKALYYGLYDQIFKCYAILYNYPIFIALFYKIIGDWLIAAKCVALFFGSAAFLPMYWLFKRFFNDTISCLSLLIFVLLQPYILLSRDVMRGSVYIFFVMMGLYLFVLQFQYKKNLVVMLSSLSLLMATWARMEAALLVISAWGFMLFVKQEHKWRRLFYFAAPYLFILGLAFGLFWFLQVDVWSLLRIEQRIEHLLPKFEGVYEGLKLLSQQPLDGFQIAFFKNVRNLIWWLALGTLFSHLTETLYFIFPVVLVVGIVVSFKKMGKDMRLLYLGVTSLIALMVLYFQIIFTWSMTSRFALLFILPAFVFMAAGVDKIYNGLQQRLQRKSFHAGIVMAVVIMALMLPKTLRANYVKEKQIINEIGQFIASKEQYQRPVKIAGALKRLRFVHFFANLEYEGAPCYDWQYLLPGGYPADPLFFRENGFHYYLWDEKGGGPQGLDWIEKDPQHIFSKVREWKSERWGRLILYEIRR